MTRLTAWMLIAAFACSGCGVGEGTGSTPPWEASESSESTANPATEIANHSSTDSYKPTVDGEESYRVRVETTKGDVVIAVVSDWAPLGAKRFRELVESGYYTDMRIFRVVPEFVVQFGMHGDPEVNKQWQEKKIKDDKVTQSNRTGYVTFATSGADSRTTQIIINLSDNQGLDTYEENFAPFGKVVEGIDVVRAFNSQYLDAPTNAQQEISERGNEFLDEVFPGLDTIKSITLIEAAESDQPADSASTE